MKFTLLSVEDVGYLKIDQTDHWKIDVIIDIRSEQLLVPGFNNDELTEILDFICTN